ncbi:TetR/AcrR family transcriptional regulator [Actinoallomurus bryophytorum]|uniref:TetR family transcriptional regulator n=1 Tax=Actinoallomurus bryophytorum TaxID=1490222 RepID=A0A543CUV9_9ACTN|nr:TetR/AcrR family transcriptional regulator [Actinoallomurus bryophytorum]TQM00904.1 TetR family transcriptional regulator [Actinoallomurus bryophytorum]
MRDYGGKSGEQRRAERRARLIDTALELFGTQGYQATSMRALLRSAGLQDRYFTESFASMEELLVAVHDKVHDAEFAAAVGAMDPAAPPVERLRQLIDAIVRGLEDDPRVGRVKILEVFGAGPLVEEHRQRGVRAYASVVAEVLPPLRADSDLDRKVLAMALVVGLNGLFMEWLTKSLKLSREQIVEHAMLLVRGVMHEACVPSVNMA